MSSRQFSWPDMAVLSAADCETNRQIHWRCTVKFPQTIRLWVSSSQAYDRLDRAEIDMGVSMVMGVPKMDDL